MSFRRLPGMLAALALALLPAACGSEGGAGSGRDLLKRAAETPPKTADVKFELEASLKGVEELEGPVRFTLEGPFRSNGQATLPDLDWRLHGEAAGKKLDLRIITVPDNVFIEYGGTTYELGEQLMQQLNQQLRKGQTDSKELRRQGFDSSEWIKDAEVSDEEVGGVPTKRVSGEVDVRKVLESIEKLFASPAFRGQLPPGASPPRIPQDAIDDVASAVKESSIETDVGRDDGIMRRNALEISFETPADQRERLKGLEGGELRTVLEFTDVNGDQHVTPPSGARPLEELLRSIGIPPELLLGPGFSPSSPG